MKPFGSRRLILALVLTAVLLTAGLLGYFVLSLQGTLHPGQYVGLAFAGVIALLYVLVETAPDYELGLEPVNSSHLK